MARTSKIVLSGAALAGLIVGVVAGIGAARMLGDLTRTVQSSVAESVPSDFAMRQFQFADTEHARAAVHFEIQMLQQLSRAEPNNSIINGKLRFAYTRLAMIEEKAGRIKEAEAAFDQARIFVKKSHPKEDMSDEQLRAAIRRFDAAFDNARM